MDINKAVQRDWDFGDEVGVKEREVGGKGRLHCGTFSVRCTEKLIA